jgi:hypothetical protein
MFVMLTQMNSSWFFFFNFFFIQFHPYVFNGLRINYIFCSCFKKIFFLRLSLILFFNLVNLLSLSIFYYYLIKIKLPYWNQPSL